jgi:enoyl-CoA hydratase
MDIQWTETPGTEFSVLKYETSAQATGVVLITLNRPNVMNAFNSRLSAELGDALFMAREDSEVRVAIVTGAGDRAFSSGGDFKERGKLTLEQWRRHHEIYEHTHRVIRTFPKPLIAAVNGDALGGGCEAAMSMDVIIATRAARFGQPEVLRGIIPGVGGSQLWPRLVPRGIALEVLMSGGYLTAERAASLGLVNQLVEDVNRLVPACLDLAMKIAEASPNAVRQVKRAVRLGAGIPLEAAIEVELECYELAIQHPDRVEGTQAFLERRRPVFEDKSS